MCKEFGLAKAFFCGQNCFKASWPTHKIKHNPLDPNYNYTGKLRPGIVTPLRYVPPEILRPDYAATGTPFEEEADSGHIPIYTNEEMDMIRASCRLGRRTLDLAHSLVAPGVTTEEIDRRVHEFIIDNNAYPSPLNYYKFPKSVCTSPNEVICHGIPDMRPLKSGDVLNIDVTVYLNGYHGDLNETYLVGDVDDDARRLVEGSYQCTHRAIAAVKPGIEYKKFGHIIQKTAEEFGLTVNRNYCGHGVGRMFHCAPNVPHYANNGAKGKVRAGHVFTIEPMVNLGQQGDDTWPDDWTAVTVDGKWSAAFEHSMVATATGVEVMTARFEDSPPLEISV